MSEENGKVCCNCKHNIRTPKRSHIVCHCDIDNHYIGYVTCMTGWCRHWARKKEQSEENEKKDEECPIKFEIVVKGNCAVCGKPLTDDRFMICKECEGK